MKIIDIQGSTGHSTIRVGEKLENLKEYIRAERAVIITDPNVESYYRNRFPPCDMITIGTGEKIKTLDTVGQIYSRLVELEADRSSFIVGIGGGIVCDVAGFAASTYMRGIGFGFVATTLLSQVDASVGGKNGVNFQGYKNIVGVFSQPEFVLCDQGLLGTLPEKEILCGLAESVKHGLIADAGLFSYLEDHYREALSLNREVMERIVYDSIVIKSSIVNRDEKEKGERKKLNFGHTFGHALEKATGIPHGEAVSIGMHVASRLSMERGRLSPEEGKRIENLLEKLKLTPKIEFNGEKVLEAIRMDKKRKGDRIDFVLLNGIGHAEPEEIPIKELEDVVKYLGNTV